jgi:UDP-N-acetylglucosamine transferase subunit ALG13
MTTFISVGNAHQSFKRLLSGVLDNFDILPQPIIVQCGHTYIEDDRCVFSDFFSLDEFNRLIKTSKLLILHGGGGSIIKAVQSGKCPVVMPRRKKYNEMINDHQFATALELSKMDLIELALEVVDLRNAIQRVIRYRQVKKLNAQNTYAIEIIKETIKYYDNYFRKQRGGKKSRVQ